MMNETANTGTPPTIADLPARVFNDRVADPDVFCGGGGVAALTAAGAGASALLVMRLSLRRKRNADHAEEIRRAIARTEAIIDRCYAAADDDIARLDDLLQAQRAAKATGDQSGYIAALAAAAESPIVLSEAIAQLLEIVGEHLPIATRFTASDLGAAATLAEGAARGALLTADVNIELLREASDQAAYTADELQARRDAALTQILANTATIEHQTRAIITGRVNEIAKGRKSA